MSETAPAVLPRSRPYLRLLWFIPGLTMLGIGLYHQYNIEDGGEVNAIKLTVKTGPVGQAAEAIANVKPGNPDLYLKMFSSRGETKLPVYKDMPIGNGLTWNLPQVLQVHDVQRVEVWQHNMIFKDDPLDRINLGGWSDEGQKFHVDLLGHKIEPPKWALPVAAAGGALTLIALLKFVWDQVI